MKAAILFLFLVSTGCGPTPDNVDNAPYRYQCSEEQMQKAASEALFCKKESGFTDTYCYGAAIMRNCELNPKLKERQT